ncbi:hypothetical protein CAEBREN_22713 [Caenorhabditis brenneri]|uniref:Serpentine receptor class gamma n=1 Tax=Caenorhabditis brenneri TaxID=135651 RepID=G0MT73_CAEBE|nr:hypothetical protein CAEBREN_22713 [Caenorhabditis brenneri]
MVLAYPMFPGFQTPDYQAIIDPTTICDDTSCIQYSTTQKPDHFLNGTVMQFIFSLTNLSVQTACICYILHTKHLKKGPFYIMLFIFSIAVFFRVLYCVINLSLDVLFGKHPLVILLTRTSLYVDFMCNFFSITMNFFLSLNGCLHFSSKKWSSWIFEGYNLFRPMVFSVAVSLLAAVGIIHTSNVSRNFIERFGYIDTGPDVGFKIILYVVYEVITLIDWKKENSKILTNLLIILSISHCLPELFLPSVFLIQNYDIKKRLRRLFAGVEANVITS